MAVKLRKICLGTRGSPLALKQTEMVRAALTRAHADIEIEIVVIKTSGDWDAAQGEARLLEAAGGKGQFAKEIEGALLAGRVDAGVHSMKDMETHLPAGLVIECMLPREDPRDVFVFNDKVRTFADIPAGAVIGTCSVRRQAFLLHKRLDLKIVPLRGNVQTRLEKLRRREQGMDGIVLAYAGLKRLGLEQEADLVIEPEDMLPSAGQGAVGIEIKDSDKSSLAIFSQINCNETLLCVKAERAALGALDGSCHTPIGALAVIEGGIMKLRCAVASLDGREFYSEISSRQITDAAAAQDFGRTLGEKLKSSLPPFLLRQAL